LKSGHQQVARSTILAPISQKKYKLYFRKNGFIVMPKILPLNLIETKRNKILFLLVFYIILEKVSTYGKSG